MGDRGAHAKAALRLQRFRAETDLADGGALSVCRVDGDGAGAVGDFDGTDCRCVVEVDLDDTQSTSMQSELHAPWRVTVVCVAMCMALRRGPLEAISLSAGGRGGAALAHRCAMREVVASAAPRTERYCVCARMFWHGV